MVQGSVDILGKAPGAAWPVTTHVPSLEVAGGLPWKC